MHLRSSLFPLVVVSAGLVLVTGVGVSEGARWYEDYELAVQQIEGGGCSTGAIEALGAAVVDKPKPRTGARTYAARTIDYLPYLQLAKAHLQCGNLELAEQYLEKCRSYGVAGTYETTVLESRIDEEAQKREIPGTAPPEIDPEALGRRLAEARGRLEECRAALTDVDEISHENSALATAHPDWDRRRDTAVSAIDFSENAIASAEEIGDLLSLADTASSLTEIRHDLLSLDREIRESLAAERIAAATPIPTPSPVFVTSRPQPTPGPVTPIPTSETGQSKVPADVRRAASAYFAADYQVAADLLREADFSDKGVQAAAMLLRGAARLALAEIGDQDDADRMARLGLADLAASSRISRSARPDPKLFPPNVVLAFGLEPEAQ